MIGLDGGEGARRGGNDSPRRGESKGDGKRRARGRLARSQSKTSASVARERFSWLPRVPAQLRESQLAHVSSFTSQRNCAIVPRTVLPDPGGPRACLDSRAFGGKREACIYVLIYAVSEATRLGSPPPIRGSAYRCGPCAIALFYGIFSRQDGRLRYRVDSLCVSAGGREARKRERETEGEREREEKKQRAREIRPRIDRRRWTTNSRGTCRSTFSRRRSDTHAQVRSRDVARSTVLSQTTPEDRCVARRVSIE